MENTGGWAGARMCRHDDLTEKRNAVRRAGSVRALLLAQTGAGPPATQEAGSPVLGWRDPGGKEKQGILSSIPAWRTPWDRASVGYSKERGLQGVDKVGFAKVHIS